MGSTLAIVVSYNPPPEIVENVEELLKQVDHVIVVDNGSTAATRACLEHFDDKKKTTCILNPSNKGVAEGINQGIRWGIEREFQFFLLMDQDSRVQPGMVDELKRVTNHSFDRGEIVLVGPSHEDFERKLKVCSTAEVELTALLITSGSLLSRSLIETIGLYDERLFIDHVDHDYSLRVYEAGGKCLKANRAVLLHRFGEAKVKTVFGKSFFIQDYSPFRRYHMTRNRVVMYKRYGMFVGEWFWLDLRSGIVDFVKLIFFEENKGPKLMAVMRGLKDGITWKD